MSIFTCGAERRFEVAATLKELDCNLDSKKTPIDTTLSILFRNIGQIENCKKCLGHPERKCDKVVAGIKLRDYMP